MVRVRIALLLAQEVAPAFEDAFLPDDRLADRLIGGLRFEFGGDFDCGQVVALGDQPRLGCSRFDVLCLDLIEGGKGGRSLKAYQDVAGLHPVALANQDGLHDPAFEMLQGLDVSLDADDARGHNRAFYRRQQRPCREARQEGRDDAETRQDRAAAEGTVRQAIGSGERVAHVTGLKPWIWPVSSSLSFSVGASSLSVI